MSSSAAARDGESAAIEVDSVTPGTGTTKLRWLSSAAFALSFVALLLQFVSVGADQLATIHLSQGIRANTSLLANWTGAAALHLADRDATGAGVSAAGTSSSSSSSEGSPSPSASMQVVPQMDVTLGFTQTCQGTWCGSRDNAPETASLLVSGYQSVMRNGGFRTAALQNAYVRFLTQFSTGYNYTSTTCKASTSSSWLLFTTHSNEGLSKFGLAAVCLSILFFAAGTTLAAYLTFLLARVDVLPSRTALYADATDSTFKFGAHQVGVRFLEKEITAHAKEEAPLAYALLMATVFSFVFAVFGMAAGTALVKSRYRCGTDVCTEFDESSRAFLRALQAAEQTTFTGSLRCRRGTAFATTIVTMVLSVVNLAVVAALFAVFQRSKRNDILKRRQAVVKQIAIDMQVAEGERAAAGTHSRAASMAAASPYTSRQISNQLPMSFGGESAVGQPILAGSSAANESFSNVSVTEPTSPVKETGHVERLLRSNSLAVTPGLEHTLGGRIAMLRDRRLLMRDEELRRSNIRVAELKSFEDLLRDASR